MKIKLETSPWEGDFETVHDYTTAVKNCLGIDLYPENIKPNPGKRAVAKMFKFSLGKIWTTAKYDANRICDRCYPLV